MSDQTHRPGSDKKPTQQSQSRSEPLQITNDVEPAAFEQTPLEAVMRTADVASTPRPPLSAREVMQLQRTIGNRATSQLVQRQRTTARVKTPTQLRTSEELGFAETGETASTTEGGLVQRAPLTGMVAADTNLREPRGKSSGMSAEDDVTPVKKDQSITVDSHKRMTKLGPDGVATSGFQTWYRVLELSGLTTELLGENMWIHTSMVTLASATPAPTPTPSAPPPSASPSASPTPAIGAGKRPDWLTKTGDSGAVDKSMTRGKHIYGARGIAMAGMRADYLADAGPSGFDPEAYQASDDALSPSGIRQGVRTAKSAVMSGAREASGVIGSGIKSGAKGAKTAVLGSGGVSGGPSESMLVISEIQNVTREQAGNLVAGARDVSAQAADKINSGDWIGTVASKLTAFYGILQPITPFIMFAKSIVGLIDKIMDYQSFKATHAAMIAKNKAKGASMTPEELAVYRSSIYAVPKVKRGVISRFAKFILDLGSTIMHFFTLVTGAVAALATEGLAIGLTLTKGAISVGEAAKGIFKYLRGTRGKNRAKNARTLVDAALNQQTEALTLLRQLNPFPTKMKWVTRLKTVGSAVVSGVKGAGSAIASSGMSSMGGVPMVRPGGSPTPSSSSSSGDDRISAYPKDNAEMYARLIEYTSGPEGDAHRTELEKQVASKLKSK